MSFSYFDVHVNVHRDSYKKNPQLKQICRVSFKNKFEELVHLVGFIVKVLVVAWK
jgi:hypothetical protein